ncbi:hypothetical protein IGI04_021925 [Brassica rapa subsp. trilocularis]|uniref:Uncharacterized protein n=1 Tax=Brassica rapa subsp. trilocularis TaxID=1813537 RepID=A0ABQ7M064_BRACM|nr:hypothetical protein IGI04_021925 [Brassica rapa subsp. trilocularis]
MKLVWSPETASKAYLDTVKSCENIATPDAAELISAMAAGWNAKLIVETWSCGDAIASSIGLNVASQHATARHMHRTKLENRVRLSPSHTRIFISLEPTRDNRIPRTRKRDEGDTRNRFPGLGLAAQGTRSGCVEERCVWKQRSGGGL